MSAPPTVLVLHKQLAMIDDFLIDCSLSEDHTFESEVTEYPVEDGSTFTDNIRPKPIVITMECLVSNTPLGQLADLRDKVSEPADDAYERFQKILAAREPVAIRTSLRTFTSMALRSLSIPRHAGRGDELRFTATFQQIQIIKNNRTTRVAVPMAIAPKTENKPPKPSTLVTRTVDPFDGTWLDPDISGWRYGASYNPTLGHEEFFKGRPIHVSQSDWATKPHLTDSEYKQLNETGLVPLDKKTGKLNQGAGQQFTIITDSAAIDAARKAGVTDVFGNPL